MAAFKKLEKFNFYHIDSIPMGAFLSTKKTFYNRIQNLNSLYLCVVQQGEKIYGAEDRDMEESEELLHGSLQQSVCS